MKVLFVGEGPHDIGKRAWSAEGSPAGGVVGVLTRRVRPEIDAQSWSIRWSQVPTLPLDRQLPTRGRKVEAARLMARRRYGSDAVVVVLDRDGKENVLAEMLAGATTPRDHAAPAVCGVAVESIEAWTLGAPGAVAEELGVSRAAVTEVLPRGVHVESLKESSGKEDHRPKALLARIAALAHRTDCVELRESVAARTDPEALARSCPRGFGAFRDALLALAVGAR